MALDTFFGFDIPLHSEIDDLLDEVVDQNAVEVFDLGNAEFHEVWGNENNEPLDASPRPSEEDPMYSRLSLYQERPKLRARFDESLSNRICYKRGNF